MLHTRALGETDRWVDLYTKDLGRIRARAVGTRKPTSKLGPHLDVMTLVLLRLAYKKQFTVTDAMVKERFDSLRINALRRPFALQFLMLLRRLVPEQVPDIRLWHYVVQSFRDSSVWNKTLLSFLGYDSLHAECVRCEAPRVNYFSLEDQSFFCKTCRFSSIPATEKIFYVG